MLSLSATAIAGAATLAVMPITATASGAADSHHARYYRRDAINAIQTTLYALAAHVYPTTVRATGVGDGSRLRRVGGVLSTYAGELGARAGGSHAFFALWHGNA